jgi:ribosomal protein L9
MKVEIGERIEQYNPIELKITIESKAEINELYARLFINIEDVSESIKKRGYINKKINTIYLKGSIDTLGIHEIPKQLEKYIV